MYIVLRNRNLVLVGQVQDKYKLMQMSNQYQAERKVVKTRAI